MRTERSLELVKLHCFVEATRDSGYKSAAFALAELIDNALEAEAQRVNIELVADQVGSQVDSISVTDDGIGMSPETLELALQFGGSTRFGSRKGPGRFGMGLPNSSLSQARRVDVASWRQRDVIWATHLDLDEILRGGSTHIPRPRKSTLEPRSTSGTVVRLSKCDRFRFSTILRAEAELRRDLGRIFRSAILSGKSIAINGRRIDAIDPLFMRGEKSNGARATEYGPPLIYSIRLPRSNKSSRVAVIFAKLPLKVWHVLSNEEKERLGISKGAGVSILRAGREIDTGWYFMGSKRKENYDDWWRCEVRFVPELDELFGVTHTKQSIRPTEELERVLTPDIERIARELNSSVRKQYAAIRADHCKSVSFAQANNRDHLLEPPPALLDHLPRGKSKEDLGKVRASLGGVQYFIETREATSEEFYEVVFSGVQVRIILNELHPFYERVYRKLLLIKPTLRERPILENLKALLAAAARAELSSDEPSHREIIHKFRLTWSNALAAFLS